MNTMLVTVYVLHIVETMYFSNFANSW